MRKVKSSPENNKKTKTTGQQSKLAQGRSDGNKPKPATARKVSTSKARY